MRPVSHPSLHPAAPPARGGDAAIGRENAAGAEKHQRHYGHQRAYQCGNSSLEHVNGLSASTLLASRCMAAFRVFSLLSLCCLAMWRDKTIPFFFCKLQ